MSSLAPHWETVIAKPLLTDPSLKSGIGMCELISAYLKKKKKKGRQGMVIHQTFPYECIILTREEKATTVMTVLLLGASTQSEPLFGRQWLFTDVSRPFPYACGF